MAKASFKSGKGNSPELFPVNIFDKIPENHPVRLVDWVVDQLDISELMKTYKGGGCSAYHPRMMLKVLFYSYLSNIYSCRKIAKALEENIHFMYISNNSTPDFRTINDFRGKRLKGHIHSFFAEVVKMLVSLGYVSLDVQYIDGTKVEATSNRYTFVWRKSVEKHKARLEEKIQQALSDIEQYIQSDNQEANKEGLPAKIDSERLKSELSRINKRLTNLSKQQQKSLNALQEKHLPKLESYEQHLDAMGDRNSYSKTDPDATFMRMKDDHMRNGQLKAGYNAQISTENQFITHASIHQTPGDTATLPSHLEGFSKAYGKQSCEVVADAGYGSEQNYELLESLQADAYVKYNYFHKEQKRGFRQNPFPLHNLFYNAEQDFFVCPMGQRMHRVGSGKRKSANGYESQVTYYQAKRCEGCPLRGQCHQKEKPRVIEVNHRLRQLRAQAKERLHSEKGLKHRSKRPIEVEAVFGQMKSNNHFQRFTMRGLDKVSLEFLLMSIGHNLRKMATKEAVVAKVSDLGSKIRTHIVGKSQKWIDRVDGLQYLMSGKSKLAIQV